VSRKIINKKTYKNLDPSYRKELIDDLFYEFSQNLKIPFVDFLKQPRQILIIFGIYLVVMFFATPEEAANKLYVLTETSKYVLVSIAILYKFTRQRLEDILE